MEKDLLQVAVTADIAKGTIDKLQTIRNLQPVEAVSILMASTCAVMSRFADALEIEDKDGFIIEMLQNTIDSLKKAGQASKGLN